MADSTQTPWHVAFPKPRNQSPASISKEELLKRMQAGEKSGKDFLLVDVRRTDYEGGTIKGSLNLPAQSLYYYLPTLSELCSNAGVKQVIFYCGSCGGRGPRAAGWFSDHLADTDNSKIESVILEGGIKGWARAGTQYTDLMDGYGAENWVKTSD